MFNKNLQNMLTLGTREQVTCNIFCSYTTAAGGELVLRLRTVYKYHGKNRTQSATGILTAIFS